MEEQMTTTASEAAAQGGKAENGSESGLLDKLRGLLGIGSAEVAAKDASGTNKAAKEEKAGGGTEDADGAEEKEDGSTEKEHFTKEDVEEAVKKAKEELLSEQAAETAEKKRLEKLTPEERQADALKQSEEKSAKLEAELMRMKLEKKAAELLSEKKLPAGLLKVLSYESEEGLKESLSAVEKAFTEALSAEVNEKLKGKTPAGTGNAGNIGDKLISAEIAKRINGGI